MITVFIEIQRQGKILPPTHLCSGKMLKSNVKNIFSYNFSRWPVGVKSYHLVLKLLRNHLKPVKTRQIWGIWKLRPAYSPETPNLGLNRWCFVPCDLEIWWMTLENNRAFLLCCFKLRATFHSHQWIQTGVTVRKRPIWVKFDDF